MQINFKTELKNLDGQTIPAPMECLVVNEKGEIQLNDQNQPIIVQKQINEPLTLQKACVNALKNAPDDVLTGMDKYDVYLLAQKINNFNNIGEISSEDISLIKKIIKKIYSIEMIGSIITCLENNN